MLPKDIKVYPPYYKNYLNLVSQETSLIEQLELRKTLTYSFFDELPDKAWEFKYATGKWTVKEILRHILDAELIFNYRALSIVRGEKNGLIGWSENDYALSIDIESLNPTSLLTSLKLQLDFTYDLFTNLSNSDLKKIGVANNSEVEVGAIGFAIIAHDIHHRNVIQNKYLFC